ncbi:SDR family NAD(P)-dependent oxidoreductase [Parahaliea sp. F7430]|uniref:SDR family NAD(P)-dependent oxidoreductase n=1 Tax=Sediminihaliea albiluteola TaxID=2758564 RepID=A0A7W2TWQ6_9GAMM|nr:SDR family NAD(P)-dependent oxidoreductase [Sediminihaliea albiluteola]MBA6413367.1 SDR family NAD(P)-dependent oxidoreductase [Sediminihaliea albiluteola]
MDDFKGKTAVVTGGASGVGRCLCEVFAKAGMNVVMADIEQSALEAAAAEMREAGLSVTGVQADVTDPDSMAALALRSKELYGNVHILCNNAGVGIKEAQRRIWDLTPNDWSWGYSVNVMGIANGIRAFVPMMLEHGEAGHIVNTSSGNGGLTSMPTTPIYASTKAAVTSITEVLNYQLQMEGAKLQAHILFPGPHVVNTNILNSMRNRPAELSDGEEVGAYTSMADLVKASGIKDMQLTEPEEVAEDCLQGIKNKQFWILPASEKNDKKVRDRTESILSRSNPMLGDL